MVYGSTSIYLIGVVRVMKALLFWVYIRALIFDTILG